MYGPHFLLHVVGSEDVYWASQFVEKPVFKSIHRGGPNNGCFREN